MTSAAKPITREAVQARLRSAQDAGVLVVGRERKQAGIKID